MKLNERLREKYSRELLEELEKAQREIEDLVRIRLRKILTSIYLGVNIDEIREKMKLPKDIPIIPTTAENLSEVKEGEPTKLKDDDVHAVLDALFSKIV